MKSKRIKSRGYCCAPGQPIFAERLETRLLLSAIPDNQNQTPTNWRWYYGVDANFLNNVASQGFRITDLSLEPGSTSLYSAALVQESGSYNQGWWWYFNQTPADLSNLTNTLQARITDLEPYFNGSQLEFAALLAPNTGADQKGWWWYYGDSATDVGNQLSANNARLIDLKAYQDGGATRYAAVMISNTGADARGWWYYFDQTPAQISTLLSANQARPVELEPIDPGHFDVIMQQDPGVEWWWYYGINASDLGTAAAQDGARIFNLEPYQDSGGNEVFAALLINNSDAVGTTVGNILRGASNTAFTGYYLKQVGGPVLESLQADRQFEPASMIKALLNLTAMRAVEAGTISLNTNLWMYYNPANPYINFNNPGNPNENPDAYADTPSNRVSLPLDVLLSRMMEISDNRATKSIETEFGITDINNTAQLAGMTNTVFASTLGSGVPGNYLTLDDAGKLYEGVLNNSLLNSTDAAQFFNNMSDQPDPGETEPIPINDGIFGPFQTDVTEEAANILGLPQNDPTVTSLANAFIGKMRGAWKGGSYTLSAPSSQWAMDVTAGGYLGVPFEDSNGNITLQDYLYGIFINQALVPQAGYPNNSQAMAVSSAWSQSQQELLRQVIHDALATWKLPHVTSFTVNGGAAQRSMVTTAQLTFNLPVNLAAGAVTLALQGGGNVPFQISTADHKTFNLTFSGTGGSLADGRYVLTVHAVDVSDIGAGAPMIADQNFSFFRLFGDYDGNGTVNNADFLKFKTTYSKMNGQAGFLAAFDYDGNGLINNLDYLQLKKRYLTVI